MSHWHDDAACRDVPDLMAPAEGEPEDTDTARRICDACPVLADCRAWVLALSQEFDPSGIVAGLTPQQRTRRRAKPVVRHPDAKECSRCRLTRPAGDFHRERGKPDGLAAYCKPCK